MFNCNRQEVINGQCNECFQKNQSMNKKNDSQNWSNNFTDGYAKNDEYYDQRNESFEQSLNKSKNNNGNNLYSRSNFTKDGYAKNFGHPLSFDELKEKVFKLLPNSPIPDDDTLGGLIYFDGTESKENREWTKNMALRSLANLKLNLNKK
jgi:hypothetical protein